MERVPPAGETFDRIAEHFDRTRNEPWPEVVDFVAARPAGGVGLDVGCGNGRHTVLLDGYRVAIGLDVSSRLLEIARDRVDGGSGTDGTFAFVRGDARRLPIVDDRVTTALYIAALHHLPERHHRIRSLDELARVLEPGGLGLVSVWSSEHDRFDRSGDFDTVIDWTLPDGETVPRFYHIYSLEGFREELSASRLRIEEAYVSNGNCFGVVAGR